MMSDIPARIDPNALQTTFSVPLTFQGEDGKTLQDVLPWFDIWGECEINQLIYAVETLHHGDVCPPLLEFQSLHCPWDTKLDDEHHYHWIVTDWDLYERLRGHIDGYPWTAKLRSYLCTSTTSRGSTSSLRWSACTSVSRPSRTRCRL